MTLYVGNNLKRITKRLESTYRANLHAAMTNAAKASKIEVVELKKK